MTNSNPNTPEAWDAQWDARKYRPSHDVWVVQRITKVASLIPPNSTVLDVASGAGFIAEYLHKSIDYTRLDFSIKALALRPEKFIRANVLTYDFIPASYSTILAMEILEHLDDPYTFIKKLALAATDQVIFTVPDNCKPPGVSRFHVFMYTEKILLGLIRDSFPFKISHTFKAGCNIICQCLK